MLISEIIDDHEAPAGEPTQDELRAIAADKKLKSRPGVRNLRFVDMPGNDSTYPAL